jgi:hypothetical protein
LISTGSPTMESGHLNRLAEEIARSLAYAKTSNETPLIVTPLLYPGGNRVVLSLREHESGFFVSDAGHAAREADLLGGGRIFPRIAREQATANEIRFDSDLIFDVDVPRDALVAAAIVVANVSKTAVELTAFRIAEHAHETDLELLLSRVEQQFGAKEVVRRASVQGAASTWRVDALIRTVGTPTVLELVAANPNSVNATVTKFLDISRLPPGEQPRRFAVLSDRDRTPHLGVLGATSRVVSLNDAVLAIAA